MNLTDKQIARFQELYKTRFHKDLDREKAYDMGIKLVRMMQIVYKPMTVADFKQLQERRKQTANL
ncbi:hypothetical protein COV53_01700 [Candidatus Gottesmanbacteria bacterium CG11_big_fil_rev_8_21_14_0_20_37_11]|uniref:Uncharacterized protein n=2 Tax=Candidatus Gottesmaniibacteriota TaxID=1752720 RepID=A0A2M7RQ98_9BACT|nr:MAG: hypothetical protein COX23_05300 [Candidatus Gottesmanbacteria bacterium CG23_combo_of_CG06-09_8_20_14_all_37_19]PIR08696.1 MAG: hypothetical protein COV53_01700 [Candidatus Gottesmanbacteria bacterium CG11_big_fil_rev_8_21_14_0_20_37_11]PIZ02442.1 MAG: hypothetical protein COY59_04830 [Candidatus Gottesmanbacteria bacterium CG_4_10_14_0_8_um_filter_37_24]